MTMREVWLHDLLWQHALCQAKFNSPCQHGAGFKGNCDAVFMLLNASERCNWRHAHRSIAQRRRRRKKFSKLQTCRRRSRQQRSYYLSATVRKVTEVDLAQSTRGSIYGIFEEICSGCEGGVAGRVFSPAEVCPVPIRPEPLDCRESSLKPMCCLAGFFPLPTASLLALPFTS